MFKLLLYNYIIYIKYLCINTKVSLFTKIPYLSLSLTPSLQKYLNPHFDSVLRFLKKEGMAKTRVI